MYGQIGIIMVKIGLRDNILWIHDEKEIFNFVNRIIITLVQHHRNSVKYIDLYFITKVGIEKDYSRLRYERQIQIQYTVMFCSSTYKSKYSKQIVSEHIT